MAIEWTGCFPGRAANNCTTKRMGISFYTVSAKMVHVLRGFLGVIPILKACIMLCTILLESDWLKQNLSLRQAGFHAPVNIS
jgi:hypothetical protein